MNEGILDSLRVRHCDISRSEKSYPARRLMRVARFLEPNRIGPAESILTYVRILDDAVDESPYVVPVKEILEEEQAALLGKSKPTLLQEEYYRDPVNFLFGERAQLVNNQVGSIINGLKMDLNMRYTQQPMTDRELRFRNMSAIYNPLAVFCIGKFGIDPVPNSTMENLMHDYGTYDNISDIFEDLPHGLVVLSREDLHRHKLHFEDGQPLPMEQLMEYNRIKRDEMRGRLRTSSSAVFELGLPVWFSVLLYTYFYTRTFKLMFPPKQTQGLIYRVPLDASPIGLTTRSTISV